MHERSIVLVITFTLILMSMVSVHAAEVTIVPHLEIVVNETKVSTPTKLNITLPSHLTIQWRYIARQNVSGSVNGVLDGIIVGTLDESSFYINRFEVSCPINKEIEVCSFLITKYTLRMSMAELPNLDNIMAKVNDEEVMCKYDPLNRSLEVSCENVTLPAKVHVQGKVGDNDFITFAGVVDIDGSLRVNELQLLTPQPIYLKVMVERVTRVIPIIIRPMYAQAEESSSSSTGYELIGRPIGLDVVLVKLTILGDDQPITATLTVMYDGEKIELLANKTIILTLPKGKHVVFRVNAEGYRQVEKTIETTSNMDLEVKLEKIGVWDYLVMALSNIAHYLSHPIYVMLLVIGITAFVALIVVLARR